MRLASIDAFWDLAACAPVPKDATRASLRRLRPAAVSTIDPSATRERLLIIAVVVLLHVALMLALRAAMQPAPMAHPVTLMPLQITIIERRVMLIQPAPRTPPPMPHSLFAPRPSALRADALQAVVIAPRVVPSPDTPPTNALLYDRDGTMHLPSASASAKRDPFAWRSPSAKLPGADSRGNAPEVRAGRSPQQTVELVGALLFGGGHYDPCQGIELQMVNLDDADARAEAEARYERSCEGR